MNRTALIHQVIALFTLVSAGCHGGSDVSCGPGTIEVDGICLAQSQCGQDMHLVEGTCVDITDMNTSDTLDPYDLPEQEIATDLLDEAPSPDTAPEVTDAPPLEDETPDGEVVPVDDMTDISEMLTGDTQQDVAEEADFSPFPCPDGTLFSLTEGCPPISLTPEVLNNFVMRYLSTTLPALPSSWEETTPAYRFTLDAFREGWLYVTTQPEGGELTLLMDGEPVALPLPVAGEEAQKMLFVSSGEHTFELYGTAGLSLPVFSIHSIPEIMLFPVSFNAWESEEGGNYGIRHDWDFISDHLAPISNVISFYNYPDFEPYIEAWQAEGKLALVKTNIPECSNASCFWGYWGEPLTLWDSLDGITVDEFHAGLSSQQFNAISTVFDSIASDPTTTGSRIYSYWNGSVPSDEMGLLVEPTLRNNFRWLHEGYFILSTLEGVSEAALEAFIDRWASAPFVELQGLYPGLVEEHLFYTFGVYNHHWGLDNTPFLDFKVFLDIQFHHMANQPGFENLYGAALYTLNHSTEEILRYSAALVRHYCLEGNTERFNNDPIILPYIQNPGFESELEGWTVSDSSPTVAPLFNDSLPFYNDVTDRPVPSEDRALQTVRDGEFPNQISQTLVNLSPGELYSVRVMVTDLTDSETEKLVPLSISLDGVEIITDETVDRPWTSIYWDSDTDEEVTVNWNYLLRVFRAEGETALLTLTDWPEEDDPGDEVGHRVLWDFIQVQRFFAAE